MKFSVEKGYGDILANFLRQLLLTKVKVWRPIGFTIGNSSNTVSAGDSVLEDSVEIVNNLCKYYYDLDTNGDFYEFETTTSALRCKDLEDSNVIKVLNQNDDIIFHSLDQDVTVNIFFAKAKGSSLSNLNQDKLKSYGISPDNVVVFSSRHTNLTSVSINVDTLDERVDIIEINAISDIEVDTNDLLKECCSEMIEIFKNVITFAG